MEKNEKEVEMVLAFNVNRTSGTTVDGGVCDLGDRRRWQDQRAKPLRESAYAFQSA